MQFISSVLGGSGNALVTSVLALGIVLVLVVLCLWLLKLIMKSGTNVRVRGRRLQVVDQVQLDAKRQLLIVRRDNVEHVILTGGPQDLVVESGIPVEKPPQPVRRPQPPHMHPQLQPQPHPEPQPQPQFRPQAAPPPRTDPQMDAPRPNVLRPHLDRLKDLRPALSPRTPSLRQTSLLRPVSVLEPSVIPMPPIAGDNSGRSKPDSATSAQSNDQNGRTSLGAQRRQGDTGTPEH